MIIVPENLSPEDLAETLQVQVVKVFDGDGFLGNMWHPSKERWVERIPFRFAFIDAPEMGQVFSDEARDHLETLIGDKSLRLVPIFKQSNPTLPIDQYKRMLCMAYLTEDIPVGPVDYYLGGKCSSGTAAYPRTVTRNIELEMIVNGLAWVVERYAFDREDEYFQAQEHAWEHRRGLWSEDNPEPPWTFKQKKRRREKASEGQLGLFALRCEAQGCDGHLVERRGAGGAFWGCSNYPRCKARFDSLP